jgi:transcriptional regulator with XRE-family HTH domain
MPKTSSNNLRRLLEKHGVRQTELSSKSGVSVSLINKIVNARAQPSPITMAKIARGFSALVSTEITVKSVFPNHQ